MRLDSKATTQSMPGAISANRCGSGPSPSGNNVITMKKNKSGLATSAGLRIIARACRENCLAKAPCSVRLASLAGKTCQLQINLSGPKAARLMTGKNQPAARLHVLLNLFVKPVAPATIQRSKRLIEKP